MENINIEQNNELLEESLKRFDQYLSFKLDEEVFAIQVEQINEILEYKDPTKVPKTADFMKGVINVRSSVVTAVDLRVKFNLKVNEITKDSVIIITRVNLDGDIIDVGVIADSVVEVFEIADEEIEQPPTIGGKIDSSFLLGIGKVKDKLIMILDIDAIIKDIEIEALQDQD